MGMYRIGLLMRTSETFHWDFLFPGVTFSMTCPGPVRDRPIPQETKTNPQQIHWFKKSRKFKIKIRRKRKKNIVDQFLPELTHTLIAEF